MRHSFALLMEAHRPALAWWLLGVEPMRVAAQAKRELFGKPRAILLRR